MVIPVPQTPPPTPRSSGLFSLKRMPLVIGVIVIVIILAVFGYMAFSKTSQIKTTSTGGQTNSSQNGTPASALPLDPSHPNISSITATYVIEGQIEKLTGSTVNIKSKGDALPTFNYTKETPVLKLKNERETETSSQSELKPGTVIIIRAVYNAPKKTWNIRDFVIKP